MNTRMHSPLLYTAFLFLVGCVMMADRLYSHTNTESHFAILQNSILVMSDTEYNLENWEITVWDTAHGARIAAVEQHLSGGNPDAFLYMKYELPRPPASDQLTYIRVFYFNEMAAYDPSAQGAIEWINYSEELHLFGGAEDAFVVSFPLIRQAGHIFRTTGLNYLMIEESDSWSGGMLSELRANNFANVIPGASPSRPDFSAGADTIFFGFERSRSRAFFQVAPEYDIYEHGSDNFTVSIRHAGTQGLYAGITNADISISNTIPAESTLSITEQANKRFSASTDEKVAGVALLIDELLHTRTGDLTLILEHHGIIDTVIFEVGGSGENFISTILSDNAAIPIENGSAPFTGIFKPAGSLGKFIGTSPYGDWTLRIIDNYPEHDGTLNAWSIFIIPDVQTTVDADIADRPSDYMLYQNYPNPFNPASLIRYSVAERSMVTLKVYDITGREVVTIVNEEKAPGTYQILFNARSLASGVYYYSLRAGAYYEVKRMVYLK